MYKFWKSGNENRIVSQIRIPDMPDYLNLKGGEYNG